VSSIYRVRVGKQGRIVLPKEVRTRHDVEVGDEVIIISRGKELTIHIHKSHEDPLRDLEELSSQISIGLTARELKEKADEERLDSFFKKSLRNQS